YSYQICDVVNTTACSASTQVCVTVVAPTVLTASPDNATTTSGVEVVSSALGNDTKTGQPASISNVTVSISTPPTAGTAVINANGTISFTSPANFTGIACYSYQICDLTSTTACSSPAQVCVTVLTPTVLTASPDNATTTSGV